MTLPKPFSIDVKRFYMPGQKLEDTCACGGAAVKDLGDEYLSYPAANAPTDNIYFYCPECDAEWTRRVMVVCTVELLPRDGTEKPSP